MRTIPILLLLTALSAGCATGPSFNRLLSDPSGASISVHPVVVADAVADAITVPVAALPEEDLSRDVLPGADKTTASAKVTGAIRQTGRVIKCGAFGAVVGLVGVPVALMVIGVKTGMAVSVNPSALTALALIGMAGGVVMAFQEPKHEFC